MTKNQWYNIRVGSKVWKNHNDIEWVDGVSKIKQVKLTGVVKTINSNCSQVLVDWGNSEIWYGRLGIELEEPLTENIKPKTMTYTDQTIMPFGKYKGLPLVEVPPSTLLWYLDNIPNLHEGFRLYIENKKAELELLVAHEKQQRRLQSK